MGLLVCLALVYPGICQAGANGVTRFAMVHDGVEREYFVYRPQHIPIDQALPVVLALHGWGSTATGFETIYQLNRHAGKNGYMLVYPQGTHFQGALGEDPTAEKYLVSSWNDQVSNFSPGPNGEKACNEDRLKFPCPPECGSCNHCGWVSCYDDFNFITRVINEAQDNYATDIDRLYLLGNSQGGSMAMRLACRMSQRFAAIAVNMYQMPPGYDCAPSRSLPLIHLYSENDDTVRPDGTPSSDGWIYTSVEVTAKTWAEGQGCTADASEWQSPLSTAKGLQCKVWRGCRGSQHEVLSCMDPLGVHDWRGQRLHPGQALCPDPDPEKVEKLWGMDLTWQFISRYRRSEL
jgi:polyhydroxybutyrate depolymerase